MPRLALALCLLFFATLFVFRSARQWRRTGSTGVKGFSLRAGLLPALAGVTTSLGLIAAPLAPLAALRGWPGGGLQVSHAALHGLGALLVLAGIAGSLRAQLGMGDSWRIGVEEGERTPLVTGGLFASVRNPIYSFMGISALGLVMLVPNGLSLAALLLTGVGVELQVRGVEEPHLRAVHGAAYREYASRVGRFVPGIGRIRSDSAP